ncbi:MAG TPA: CBS domain-containing protein [Longimicrobiales bacterium]
MLTHEQDLALAHRLVGDIMESRVITVRADLPLSEAARLLWEQQITGAPVVDEKGHPVGVLSASDIVRVKGFGAKKDAVVSDVMTHATFAVRASTTVAELARFLMKANVHRALVMDGSRLIGIVSTSDIVREIAELAPLGVEPDELPLRIADEEC